MADFQEEVYIIERKEVTDDEEDDEEFQALQKEADAMQDSDDGLGVASDEDDDLMDFANLKAKTNAKATQRLKETKRSGGDYDQALPEATPKILERDVVIDDFIRNFLQRFQMKKTMNTFQKEWYELQKKGVFQDNGIGLITDIANKNSRLSLKIEKMTEELTMAKVKAEQAKSTWDKLRKERDFHKGH